MNKDIIHIIFYVSFILSVFWLVHRDTQQSEEIKEVINQAKQTQKELIKTDSLNTLMHLKRVDSINVAINFLRLQNDTLKAKLKSFKTKEKKLEKDIDNINSIIGELPNF